jgi:hypothetical protein
MAETRRAEDLEDLTAITDDALAAAEAAVAVSFRSPPGALPVFEQALGAALPHRAAGAGLRAAAYTQTVLLRQVQPGTGIEDSNDDTLDFDKPPAAVPEAAGAVAVGGAIATEVGAEASAPEETDFDRVMRILEADRLRLTIQIEAAGGNPQLLANLQIHLRTVETEIGEAQVAAWSLGDTGEETAVSALPPRPEEGVEDKGPKSVYEKKGYDGDARDDILDRVLHGLRRL